MHSHLFRMGCLNTTEVPKKRHTEGKEQEAMNCVLGLGTAAFFEGVLVAAIFIHTYNFEPRPFF